MGVKGLWRLLLPIGRRISIETLEGRILAIDASIWLTQFLTVAARQREQDLLGDGIGGGGSSKAYSYDYLVGFLRRLCKLRYQGVRPVLVFDGETPEIKKREIRERLRRRKRKLGESFYLGGDIKNKNGDDFHTQEEEELLEATRRMAKRILAKQIRTGQLLTTKSKDQKQQQQQQKSKKQKTGPKANLDAAAPDAAGAKPNAAAASNASYAPGFYDPDAAVTSAQPVEKGEDVQSDPKDVGVTAHNSGDDDHLLRDDYNTNPLQEEINDWDRPIVIKSDNDDDDDDDDDDNGKNRIINHDNRQKNHSTKKKNRYFGSAEASKFHAGDGTKFRVESVANLPESARKDVIEDARKQRRLASRREFLKVASDPDGLSSCQLRNFLKSTKLNRDIAKMAQAAKAKAEEEAKMVRGNGILFEKDENYGAYGFTSSKTNSYATSSSHRQHYRYTTFGGARNGRKKSNLGMMRIFHHNDQPEKGDNGMNNEKDVNDEHDFRKARNNHYLSGGIRFVASDEDDDDKDEDVENLFHQVKDANRSHYYKPHSKGVGVDDFIVAVMDGSDKKPRNNAMGIANSNPPDEIIHVESSSESDESDFAEDRKLCSSKAKTNDKYASQELQDEALARALQNIEEEEDGSDGVLGKAGAREYIEIGDSDDDSHPSDSCGFFQNSCPSEDVTASDQQLQHEREDAELAQALQKAEYGEEDDGGHGGGFLAKSGEGTIHKAQFVCNKAGISMPKNESFCSIIEGDSDYVGRFQGQMTGVRDDKKENWGHVGGFILSTKGVNDFKTQNMNDGGEEFTTSKDGFRTSSKRNENGKIDAQITQIGVPSSKTRLQYFSSKNSSSNALTYKHGKIIHHGGSNLDICHESSDDEDIDWEDGNSTDQIKKDLKEEISHTYAVERDGNKSVEHDMVTELSQRNKKICEDNLDDDKEDDMKWNDAGSPLQSRKECVSKIVNAMEGNTLDESLCDFRKNPESTNLNMIDVHENDEEEMDENEVDWKDGEVLENKSAESERPAANVQSGSDFNQIEKFCDENNEVDLKKRDEGVNEGFSRNHEDRGSTKGTLHSRQKDKKKSDYKDENYDDNDHDGKSDSQYGFDNIMKKGSELYPLFLDEKADHSFIKGESKEENWDDDDDDKIDWEEGHDKSNNSKTNVIDLCEEVEFSNPLRKLVLDSVIVERREASDSDRNKENCEGEGKTKVSTLPTETKEELRCKIHHKETSRYFVTATHSISESKTFGKDSNDDDSIEWEAAERNESINLVDADDWGATKIQPSDEVAAALEHAQGTAANLTNWAGRAFRRAIVQHAIENGMEIPKSAKPGVQKKARKDVDRDESFCNQQESNIIYTQRTTNRSIPGRNHSSSRSTESSGKIDNTAWLDNVDKTSISPVDCTATPEEANPSDRFLDTAVGGVTDEMRTEVMQLLHLFGIPYVVAPAEAEAQCVELERLGLVDGIVTEDSDTFVFGGQVIYKNIFEDKKYVEVYHAKDAIEEMNLNQDALVALAMLLGGDYTEGVKGVGIVNGMEVLQAFDVAQGCEAGLRRFRKWLNGFDPNDLTKSNSNDKNEDVGVSRSEKEQLFHRKHHTARTRWIAPKHFPDIKVLNAYLNPVVDTSAERFSWGIPDLDGLISFCQSHMGWVAEETEKVISPIIRRMEEGSMRQTRIDSFMRYEDGIKFAKIQSKRLRRVLGLPTKDATTAKQPRGEREHKMASETSDSDLPTSELREAKYGNTEQKEFYNTSGATIFFDTSGKKANKRRQPNKKYNGKRTRSLAALSSASASTVAIASSSKNHDTTRSTSAGCVLDSTEYGCSNTKSLSKKAPPAYREQSALLEEQKENPKDILEFNETKSYKVINPSIL